MHPVRAAEPGRGPRRRRARGLGRLVPFALLLVLAPRGTPEAWARRGDSAGASRAALLRQVQPQLERGAAALAARDFATAGQVLGSAYRSAPLPEVLLQLARLAQAAGLPVEAYDLYRRYLADPTRIPDSAAVAAAEAVVAQPPPPSGSLAVNGPPSAIVVVDGRIVGVLPLPQPLLLAPGDHTLLLELGRKRIETPLQVQEGRLAEVRTGRSSGALLISILPALLVLDELPGVPAESGRLFGEAVERAAIAQQLGVMPAAVALRQGPELGQCLATRPCQQQLAKRSGLEYVLRSRVARAAAAPASPTAGWTFELTLLHAEVEEPASQVTGQCAACTPEQAAARYREALTELLTRGLPRQLGTAEVTSDPPGAALTVANRPVGKTPLYLQLWEGSYELALRLPGYQPATPALTITAAKKTPLSVQLEADPLPAALPPAPADRKLAGTRLPRPRWRLAVGGSLVSLGALLLSAGGLALLADGRCYLIQPPEASAGATQCRVLYDTKTSGLATVGVGFSFGIAGAVLLAIPGARRSPAVSP